MHSVAVHPIIPHTVACCTRTGLCVLQIQKQWYLRVHAILVATIEFLVARAVGRSVG